MLKYNEFINEKNESIYTIEYKYNDKDFKFTSKIFRKVYTDVIEWLYKSGYEFDETVVQRKLFKKNNIPNQYLGKGLLYNIENTDLYIIVNLGIQQAVGYLKMMLYRFGVDLSTFNFKSYLDDSNLDVNIDSDEVEIDNKSPNENPFKQSICVLGGSGVGKSVTIENVLENEGHTYEYIIPTAATTGILAQFSPSKSTYVPSRLGSLLLQAANDPSNLYTAVFDEMHKSNVIEMINDELLQAISTKRNRGVRFISLDQDTAEMYQEMETKRGNIIIPDNFGFIFISSKPKVIANNADFFNRVDIIILEEKDRNIDNSDELLDKVLSDEEKSKLSSVRND